MRHSKLLFGTWGTVALLALVTSSARAELVAFYDFDDASSADTAVDVSGNGNDAELIDAEFTGAGEGRTGGGTDRALDFGAFDDGAHMSIPSAEDGAFETLTDNDAATITFWLLGGDEQPVNQWHFWFGPGRQLGSHVPWGNGTVYFDVAGCCNETQRVQQPSDPDFYTGEWTHYAFVKDEIYTAIYQNGELFADSEDSEAPAGDKAPLGDISEVFFGAGDSGAVSSINGLMDDIGIWDNALTVDEIQSVMENGLAPGVTKLQAGDADQDLDFDQLDLVKVQIAGQYLSGNAATWGDGDWDGAPGGEVGSPPAGDGVFNQLDIISALNAGTYLTGPYGAIAPGGSENDGQTSITYNPGTGEVGVDAPAGVELTSVNIDSAAGIFTGDAAANLGGSFDNDTDGNIFKATFGGSFGSISLGNVAQTGLSEDFVAGDLTVVGSLSGGGDLGDVDLIYVPEPSAIAMILVGFAALLCKRRR